MASVPIVGQAIAWRNIAEQFTCKLQPVARRCPHYPFDATLLVAT